MCFIYEFILNDPIHLGGVGVCILLGGEALTVQRLLETSRKGFVVSYSITSHRAKLVKNFDQFNIGEQICQSQGNTHINNAPTNYSTRHAKCKQKPTCQHATQNKTSEHHALTARLSFSLC